MKSLSEQFLAFARSKPAGEEYEYWDYYDCPCAQFGRELGLLSDGETFAESEAVASFHYLVGDSIIEHPRTFGALAGRLEAARSDLPLGEGVVAELNHE